ncbi:MAG: hypothetical protein CL587_02385 [Alteromonadaceae bacterium]|nr:hypothetical protein [Alteromonadaceae bacterium]
MILFITTSKSNDVQQRYLRNADTLNIPVILRGNGVYQYSELQSGDFPLYVLADDAESRGVNCDESDLISHSDVIRFTQQYGKWIVL